MKLVYSLSLSLALGACSYDSTHNNPEGNTAPTTKTSDSLELAKQRWQEVASSDYDYYFTQRCYCLQAYQLPMQVSVRNGQVVSARYTDKQAAAEIGIESDSVPPKIQKHLHTIDYWFSYLDKGHREGYFRLEGNYHPELGYPTQIISDRRQDVADDEIEIFISELRTLD